MNAERHVTARSWRYGLAAMVMSAGLVVAPVHGVAWADTTDPPSTSTDSASTDTPDSSSGPTTPSESGTDPADAGEDTPGEPRTSVLQSRTDPKRAGTGPKLDRDQPLATRGVERSVRTARAAADSAASVAVAVEDPAPQPGTPEPTQEAAARAVVSALPSAAAQVTTPVPPKPLSPIAQVLELPGRIVNAVLQFLDLTSAAGPRSPFNIAPINDLLFAAFREIERLVGLHRTPAVQPVLPTMTYSGPTDRPTPTVAQFLNASTAAYGWGTTPGGMVPFTVNGFQLQSTNVFSGMSGKAWVTPQGQVIIAYQGTTGGTNLLINPLITLSQIAADMQVILTGTTPLAFYDALRFARRVQEEAALQGYAAEDVFVTGHSLGGWEAQFVAQRTGLAGIGFEAPGLNTKVAGNGADTNFVNIAQYGSPAAFMATDLPGLQPFFPSYVPSGGAKPHYGPIVVIGDRAAMNPMVNASALWGKSLIGSLIFAADFLGNFFQYHLMGVQAYHLDVDPDPGVVPWLGTGQGTVHTGYGELTIQQLLQAASDDGILIRP